MLPHQGVWCDQVRPAATIAPSREGNRSSRPPVSFTQHALGNLHLANQPLHPEEPRCSCRTACSVLSRQNTTQEESLRRGDALSSRVWRPGGTVRVHVYHLFLRPLQTCVSDKTFPHPSSSRSSMAKESQPQPWHNQPTMSLTRCVLMANRNHQWGSPGRRRS